MLNLYCTNFQNFLLVFGGKGSKGLFVAQAVGLVPLHPVLHAVGHFQSHVQGIILQPCLVAQGEGIVVIREVIAATVQALAGLAPGRIGGAQHLVAAGVQGAVVHLLRVIAPGLCLELGCREQAFFLQGIKVDEVGVARKGGAALIGAVAVAGGAQGQQLPDLLPGIGQNAATMITYNQSKSVSKPPERFGHGSPEGICASETSNNAVNGGALIPLVTMGIPGDLTTSALLGGLTIHGLQAGPLLFTQNPDIMGTIMVAYALANFVMYIMELGLLKLFIRAIDVKFSFLFPAILMFCVMGVLALNNRMFDVWMMMLFGVVAYVLEQLGVDMTPIILGFILGPMIEKYFRSAMIASSGMFLDVFTRPISCVFMIVAVTFLLLPLFKMLRCRQKARKG